MRFFFLVAALSLTFCVGAGAAEPIIGTWQLDHQELNGHKKETEPVTLRVTPDGDKFLFAFSVPVNNIDFVSMTYSAKLDGTDADIKNARGIKVGTVRISSHTPMRYDLTLKGEGRPESSGHLTVSADKNTLTSESDATQDGHSAHLVQWFTRH